MTLRTIDCAECGETVPYGRLSCPACGALLASVAGAARPTGDEAPSAMPPSRVERSGPRDDAGTIGSYEPPGTTLPPILTPVPEPPNPAAVPPLPASAGGPAVPDTAGHGSVPASASSSSASIWSIAGLDVGIDRAVALGAGLVAIGLLLPWSRVVIGSPNLTSYFGTWGLAGPGHIVVLAAAVAIAVLAGIPNRVPVWLRSGAAGILLGGFVLGLLWPYVVGPLGAAVGSLVSLVGAMVLAIAGVAALWLSRHATDEPGV